MAILAASVQEEMDTIYSLLPYSLVYQDWRPENIPVKKEQDNINKIPRCGGILNYLLSTG
jgi:hypothetical protein